MDYSTDNFRSLLNTQSGIAHGNRFKVELPTINGTPKPGGERASDTSSPIDNNALCTASSLPGSQMQSIPRVIGGERKNVGIIAGFGDVALTFYLTNTYSLKYYFDEWQDCVVSKTPPFEVGYFNDYVKPVTIHQLDKLGAPVYSVRLIDAYPSNVADIGFNNQLDAAPVELTVTLTYVNFEIV